MATLARLHTALRSSLNELLAQLARGEDVRSRLRQFDELAGAVRGQLGEARDQLRSLQDDLRRALAEAREAEAEAVAALRADDEGAARGSLSRKLEREKEAAVLSAALRVEEEQLGQVEETLGQLEDGMTAARRYAASLGGRLWS